MEIYANDDVEYNPELVQNVHAREAEWGIIISLLQGISAESMLCSHWVWLQVPSHHIIPNILKKLFTDHFSNNLCLKANCGHMIKYRGWINSDLADCNHHSCLVLQSSMIIDESRNAKSCYCVYSRGRFAGGRWMKLSGLVDPSRNSIHCSNCLRCSNWCWIREIAIKYKEKRRLVIAIVMAKQQAFWHANILIKGLGVCTTYTRSTWATLPNVLKVCNQSYCTKIKNMSLRPIFVSHTSGW